MEGLLSCCWMRRPKHRTQKQVEHKLIIDNSEPFFGRLNESTSVAQESWEKKEMTKQILTKGKSLYILISSPHILVWPTRHAGMQAVEVKENYPLSL